MKMRLELASLALVAVSLVQAFPADSGKGGSAPTPFDGEKQRISTSGLHAFKPPGPHDQRGPCPGLNAMANHGYLPRSGFATIPQFVLACTHVFGMGKDLATILAAYGAALDGPGVGWSIGGTKRLGIGGSHNNYESDNSPMRGDLHQYGSNTNLVMSQFHRFYNLQPDAETANYDLDVLTKFRGIRFQESIEKNPVFYYAPFSGAIVTQAAYTFIYRFMSNKSQEYPDGRLDKKVLKSFMSVQGPENNLKWVAGHERIPDNWYTRNKKDPYNIDYLSKDINYVASKHPEITQAGCNQGKVNTFTKINVTAMTNGKYNNNPSVTQSLCVGLAYALTQAGALGVVANAVEELILPVQNQLGCTTVPDLNTTVAKACPSYSLYGGPTAKVAKGAIQS